MSVVVSMQDVGPCRKQLTVEVPAPAVEAETLRVTQEIGRRAKVPGFRKGKVPVKVLQLRFKEDIEREVLDRLVPRYWRQAQAESDIEPLLPPQVEQVELTPGEPLMFVATVETRPEIQLGDTRHFELPDKQVTVTDEEVEEVVEELRRQAADWVPVERAAANGDRVVAEIVELGDGNESEPQVLELEVGEERVWEELSLAVTGLSAQQESTFSHREGEGEAQRQRRFRVKVMAVKERELPSKDDELASKVGEFENLAALRRAVRQRLETSKAADRHQERQRSVLDQLRERHPIELPLRVVEREIESLLRDYATSLSQQGVDVSRSDLDWNRLAEQVRPQAERRVHARLLLDAIAEAESVAVAETEFEQALSGLARQQGTTTAALRRALDDSGGLAGLRAQLRREKVLRSLMGETEEAKETLQETASAQGE